MPEFLNPFQVKDLGRPMNLRELQRALRQSIAAEEEAVHLYEAYADASELQYVKKVFQDIADEEKVHVGEFQELLNRFDSGEREFLEEGADEVQEMLSEDVIASRVAKAFIAGRAEDLEI